ncbi:MAG: hypothetical protein AAF085_05600 [Planctomycetota bacterium]
MQKVKGPFAISYGFGWVPTETWWTEARRFHVYSDPDYVWAAYFDSEDKPEELYCLEVARIEDADWPGIRAYFSKRDYAIEVGMQYLQLEYPLTTIQGVHWFCELDGINEMIPHPPTLAMEGNISVIFMDKEEVQNCL